MITTLLGSDIHLSDLSHQILMSGPTVFQRLAIQHLHWVNMLPAQGLPSNEVNHAKPTAIIPPTKAWYSLKYKFSYDWDDIMKSPPGGWQMRTMALGSSCFSQPCTARCKYGDSCELGFSSRSARLRSFS